MNILRLDKTGAEVFLRPISPDDEELLRRFYLELTEKTFRSFYGYSTNRNIFVRKEKISQECHVDQKKDLRLVAMRNNEIIGLGMLVGMDRFTEANYEIGHLISDDYQKHGVGSLLMEAILEHAKAHSKGKFIVAYTSAMNIGARKLLQKFDFVLKNTEYGEMTWIYTIS